MINKISIYFLLLILISPYQSFAQKVSSQIDQYLGLVRSEFSGQNALETTAFVADHWRSPGNSGFDASIYHVQKKLEAAGYVQAEKGSNEPLSYRLERYPLGKPAWDPIDAKIFLPGEKKPLLEFSSNRNMIAINSFSTPAEGIEAEVVYIESCTKANIEKLDLKGKIVFGECSAYSLFKLAVEKKGAIGILSYNIPYYNQPEKHQHSIPFTGIPLNSELKTWSINLSYAAKTAIHKHLKKGPLKLKVNIETKIFPSEELTLIAEVRGRKQAEKRFVFSAHVQEPGANDNASGVGAQTEMARVAATLIKKGTINPDRTITFLWGVEIKSTNRYINQDSARAAGIHWGMSLDMVGEDTEKTGGTFLIEKMPDPSAIWTRGEDKHTEWGAGSVDQKDFNPHYFNDLIEFVCRRQAIATNWTVNTNPFEGGSDHQPFLNAQIPGLLLWHFTDVFYHTDADRIDKVSPTTLSNVGISALSSALMLTKATEATASDVIKITEQAALKRLKTEGRLSAKEINSGASVVNERNIIWAWGYWYGRALPKIEDILIEPASEELKTKLNNALIKIGQTTLEEMSHLDKSK